tara:strand:- start:338 stop:871 length:534 start_codon:yes stop_codon:yes gene_type:complete
MTEKISKLISVFIFLFLAACAGLERPSFSGMDKKAYCLNKTASALVAICDRKYYYYDRNNNIEVLKKGDSYAIFKNVTEPTGSGYAPNRYVPSKHHGNGTFVTEVTGWAAAQNEIDKLLPKKQIIEDFKTEEEIEEEVEQEMRENSTSIDEAKTTCLDLGFKEGTEKFGECVLQLTK